ncbi:hypothetical protein QVZ41_00585 [Wenyingzhuangia sp. chi5]|uniref:Outer membrane protein beta-barrel domain-containing protein n=1 Tax=Wenyingzhuangia gilva TaxID=3057677 RepID=A0ABT8VN07_9FLAO|nr:hypothetical protein [Wenyingzhuangia sp. chi5]MDO3693343.1 hypothetical protein [Wenyingzhuangia sp. chi5]
MPGYIINQQKDTIKGLINYLDWDKTPIKINFKSKLTEKDINYTPKDIVEFSVNHQKFISTSAKTLSNSNKTNQLSYSPKIKLTENHVFLQTIYGGVKSLYQYISPTGIESFYIKKDNTYEILIYNKYLKKQKSTNITVEQNFYIEQLKNYFKNSIPLKESDFKNTKYNLSSLSHLFEKFYKINLTKTSYKKAKEKIDIEFGLTIGASIGILNTDDVTFSRILLNSENEYEYYLITFPTNYNKSYDFTGGFFLNVTLPKKLRRWSINNEVFYTNLKFSGTSKIATSQNYSEIAYSSIRLNNMARYTFPLKKLFIFINAGIINGFAYKEANYGKIQDPIIINDEGKIYEARKYEQGLLAGVGLKYKKTLFEIRYDVSNGISNYGLITKPKRISFLLSYTL